MRRLNPVRENPKLSGSSMVDCIPQVGNCPNECTECYYNGGGFFTDKKSPLIPTLEEVGDKIVRVNCLEGSTKISLVDGTEREIRTLVNQGEIWVYSCIENKDVIPFRAVVIPTRKNANLLEITIDNGEKIKCTPDHRWMLSNGTYIKAEDLTVGQSLMPLYRKKNIFGYELHKSPKTNFWRTTHRYFVLGDRPTEGKNIKNWVVHHKNVNKSDNRPENLVWMSLSEHKKLHSVNNVSKRPDVRLKNSISHKKLIGEKSPRFRHDLDTQLIAELYNSGVYSTILIGKLLNCDSCTVAGRLRSVGIKLRNTRSKIGNENAIKANLKRWKDPMMRDKLLDSFHKPSVIEAKIKAAKNRWSKPNARIEQSITIKNRWDEGVYNCNFSERTKKGWATRRSFNHKVISVEAIPEKGECFDLVMDKYHNFALSAGVFVHNSGHDSNLQKELVLKVTEKYTKKFYNTSIPDFEFPAPVTFTCNGRDTDFSAMMVVRELKNLMAVRFRTNLWNLDLLDEVVSFYASHGVPVTITFMRYTDISNIPEKYRKYYEMRKSILNIYYCLSREKQMEIVEKYPGPYGGEFSQRIVGMCGTPESSYCRDCQRCVWAYNKLIHQNEWVEAFNSIGD